MSAVYACYHCGHLFFYSHPGLLKNLMIPSYVLMVSGPEAMLMLISAVSGWL